MISKHPHCIDLDKVCYDSGLLAVFSRSTSSLDLSTNVAHFLPGLYSESGYSCLATKGILLYNIRKLLQKSGAYICAIPLFVSDRSVAATTPRRGFQLSILDVGE